MTEAHPVRPLDPSRIDDFVRASELSFHSPPSDEELEQERTTMEPDRALAALDGDRIVGTAHAYSFELAIPGATIPAAGVSAVGVDPGYRRRGILRSLMRRQLDDVRARGESVAVLWASEGGIYARFGYGVAASGCVVDIERSRVRFLDGTAGTGPGRVRMVGKDEVLAAGPGVHDAVMQRRPGIVSRSPAWWTRRFGDPQRYRFGYSELFFVVHEVDGHIDGYAAYRFKGDWNATGPKGKVRVEELLGATDEAHAKLWRYVTDIDLSVRIEHWNAAVDDAFFAMLADPRAPETRVKETLWVRMVDVERALAARRYAVADRLVVEVRDDVCPWNTGRYDLRADIDGAECGRTDEEPDLVLGASELGSIYLGGVSPSQLVRAGRGSARTPAVERRAETLFRWSPAPWTVHVF